MSIRDFQKIPCPICKVDTTHYMMKCAECGHVQEHPFAAFENRTPQIGRPIRETTALGAKLKDVLGREKAKRRDLDIAQQARAKRERQTSAQAYRGRFRSQGNETR